MDEKLKPLFTPWRIGNCVNGSMTPLASAGAAYQKNDAKN